MRPVRQQRVMNVSKNQCIFHFKVLKLFPLVTFSTLKINLQNIQHCFYVIFTLFCIQIKLKVEIKVAFLLMSV